MTKRCVPLLAWLAVTGLRSVALAQPIGPEFQVNTYTTGFQASPSVASDSNGNFVVVWSSEQDDGQGIGGPLGVFGQRYDSSGHPLGPEFQVNTYTKGFQSGGAVASDAKGNFVVVWTSGYYQDGGFHGIFGQRYDRDGNRIGGEFQVNTYTTGSQEDPSVASDATGDFVVVWESHAQEDGNPGIFGQRFDPDGNRIGDEFHVNTYTTDLQNQPSVAADALGNFLVVWASKQDGGVGGFYGEYGIFGQRYDAAGNRLGGEFQVNTYTTNEQEKPDVTSDATGIFVVIWTSYQQEECPHGINCQEGVFGQRYDSDGTPLGGEFQINTYTSAAQDVPSVTSDADGHFVVVWESCCSQDGHAEGIFGQRYDPVGNRVGGEFQINTYTTDSQSYPSVASDASGNFIVVWDSRYQDGGGGGFYEDFGIFGQRFAAGCEASVRVQGEMHIPGSTIALQIHIAHHRPKTVTVPWELRLIDPSGQPIVKRTTQPHTFESGDVVDRDVQFQLPNDLASGTYTLELAISGMAGTKGASTTFQIVGPSSSQ